MAAGDLATARDATLFLFERQQLADGSMPRNSLVNGKTAPDSFGTQLDETAYPILMADQLGLDRRRALRGPHQAGRELRRQPRPLVRRRAVGGAGRLLALDDRRRDRRADRRRRPRRRQRRPGLGRRLARRRRRLPALDQGLDGHDQRPARADPYFIRLSKTGDPNAAISYNVGNGGPDARPARRHRRRLPRAHPARRAAGDDPDVVAVAARRRRHDPSRTRRAGPAGTATTATATATASSDGRPVGADRARAPGTCGRCSSSERAEQSLQTGDATGAAALLDGMASSPAASA